MIQWLHSELGALMIAALGYVLREFSENQNTPERILDRKGARFLVRLVLALSAGVIALLVLPHDAPNHVRVFALLFAGAATPEIVRLLISAGLNKLNRATRDDEGNGR